MQLQLANPAPLLNTADFHRVFSGESPLITHFECVGLPGAVLEVVREIGQILEVCWKLYGNQLLYVDKRFGRQGYFTSPEQKPIPSANTLLARMEQRVGASYVWGGNWSPGIPEMIVYYPPQMELSAIARNIWTFKGLDCSGLLFEASEGTTPRNTSQLIHLGRPVPKGEALAGWKPMDMIVYPGHVLFVRDTQTIIESKSPFGVRICPMQMRLEELLKERVWVDEWTPNLDPSSSFMVRRFC